MRDLISLDDSLSTLRNISACGWSYPMTFSSAYPRFSPWWRPDCHDDSSARTGAGMPARPYGSSRSSKPANIGYEENDRSSW